MQKDQNARGASRCLLFVHGFKTAVAMRAAHAAMTIIMSHNPPVDYRVARWQHVPVYGTKSQTLQHVYMCFLKV